MEPDTQRNRVSQLTPEEADLLTSHAMPGVSCVHVATALKKLPGGFDGVGEWPEGFRVQCQSCNQEIGPDADICTPFGNFYHVECVPYEGETVTMREWFGGEMP